MKIIAIGDIHGRNLWKEIVKKEKDADTVVFVGDYFDSWHHDFETQLDNFIKIIKYKMDNPEKVILLLGNHDYHYLSYVEESYSGFQPSRKEEIGLWLERSIEDGLIQIAYQYEDYLFSHAGITQTWLGNNPIEMMHDTTIADKINSIFKENPKAFKFTASNPLDNTGDSITQPPIWVRPRALESDAIEGFTQVVGHTMQPKIKRSEKVVYIDSNDKTQQYLIIQHEDGKLQNFIDEI